MLAARCAATLASLAGCTTLVPWQGLDAGAYLLNDDELVLRAPQSLPPRVFLLRGLWEFFSFGLDDLAVELRALDIDALVLSGTDWLNLAELLHAEYADGDMRPLVLIGHSYGADNAVSIARYLHERRITVDLLALVDATNPPAIPSNVDHCVQWYIPTELSELGPHSLAGNPVVAAPDNDRTLIENRLFTLDGLGPLTHGANHLNIDEHPYLHELVILEIQNLVSDAATRMQAVQD